MNTPPVPSANREWRMPAYALAEKPAGQFASLYYHIELPKDSPVIWRKNTIDKKQKSYYTVEKADKASLIVKRCCIIGKCF
ncbi:hypothetical protein [Hydrogenoanaerobacterium sp.]|uniref:hypothetical protein n=1 Tax=Hydrogenoanaerobacterium sp. TaxID=2953763 RepID=UPI00289AE592|nr:hypothetical protein [Hydrogenoanaerobacterium sp.]